MAQNPAQNGSQDGARNQGQEQIAILAAREIVELRAGKYVAGGREGHQAEPLYGPSQVDDADLGWLS